MLHVQSGHACTVVAASTMLVPCWYPPPQQVYQVDQFQCLHSIVLANDWIYQLAYLNQCTTLRVLLFAGTNFSEFQQIEEIS